MRMFLILILISLFSCKTKGDNFLKEYSNQIKFFKNTIYNGRNIKCNILNTESYEIFKKNRLFPIFRIEKMFCNSIWLLKNQNNDYIIYYFNISTKVNKNLTKVKSFESSYELNNSTKVIKDGKIYLNRKIKGTFFIYKKNISRNEQQKIKEKIKYLNKKLSTCESDIYDFKKYSNIYITSKYFNTIIFSNPILTKEKQAESLYPSFYKNKNCINIKYLIDLIESPLSQR